MQELKKIKTIQVHRGGGLILSMDYSTLEVRIFCAICGDPLLKEVLNSGKDLHCQTARAIFPELKGLSDKEIKEHHNGLRSKAKSCFVAGTKVLMSNNSTKNIEDIKVGDVVVSREEFTDKLILSRVRHSGETNKVKELIELQLSNSTTLRCTPDHKIRLKNGKYKEAKYIVTQDIVDSEFSIISISHIQLTEAIPVYDIEVENESNSHNFCANGIFVHNCIFGLLYGKSTFNFAKEWGCTVDEAQAVLDGLMGAYPAIKTYVAAQHEFAKKNGYVANMFGQKRPLPGAQLPEFGPTKKQFRHAMNAAQNSPIQCFLGNTKIDLLDGTQVEIKDLVGNTDGKYVYSCKEDGTIIPGKIINAFESGKTTNLLKITLDNNETITCTKEHQFMLRSGKYAHAINLRVGDSLMPLYYNTDKEYLRILNNKSGKLKYVHRLVSEYYNRATVSNGFGNQGEVIHHIDFNRLNNNPTNLVIMDKLEHIKYHSNLIKETMQTKAEELGMSYSEYMRYIGGKYTNDRRSQDAKKRFEKVKNNGAKCYWEHFLTEEHAEKQKIAMAQKNKDRKTLYPDWDKHQREAVRKTVEDRIARTGNCFGLTKEEMRQSGLRTANYIWNDPILKEKLSQNIRDVGSRSVFLKFRKISLQMVNEYNKEILWSDQFESLYTDFRKKQKNPSAWPLYSKKLLDELIQEQFYNHKVVSIEHIHYEQPVSVYDIEIENKDNTHNFALSAGVFVHNSSASIMAWIAGTHVQEEFCLQNMQSVMIGGVHDSTYVDVYPGELITCMKIFNFHAEVAANKIHNWMNGVHLPADFGLGQSWGRELDVKKWEQQGDRCILTLKGGNVNWEYLKRELDEAYDYKLISIEDGDDIPPEEREDIPVRQSDKYVTVKLDFPDPHPNLEYKSKYYVGNKFFGERIDPRQNPIKSVL